MWPIALQEEYVRRQGPFSPELFTWLEAHGASQDRVLFFTYLYPTSYFGIPCCPAARVDLYPLVHDEPPAHLPIYARRFQQADRLIFCTPAERQLARQLYHLPSNTGVLLGYGIDTAPPVAGSGSPVTDPYLLYVGRIDPSKGVGVLLDHFVRWRAESAQHRLRLVLIGERAMPVPKHPDIEYRGRASEAEKSGLLAGARALINPSPFESLGLVILEAFVHGTPTLVSASSAVLVDHCRRSGGGLWYDDYAEFAAALSWLVEHPQEARALGARGRAYAETNYSRDIFEQRLATLYPASGS